MRMLGQAASQGFVRHVSFGMLILHRIMKKIGGKSGMWEIGGKSGMEEVGGKSGIESIRGKNGVCFSSEYSLWIAFCSCPRHTEFVIVSMASQIGTNVESLHDEFSHWSKL